MSSLDPFPARESSLAIRDGIFGGIHIQFYNVTTKNENLLLVIARPGRRLRGDLESYYSELAIF